MARILIVGADDRAGLLGGALAETGHAVRLVTRAGAHGGAHARSEHAKSEHPNLEVFTADPERLATLRVALERVTVACWLFGDASGSQEELDAWHGTRLEAFMRQLVDSSARALLYEAPGGSTPGSAPPGASPGRDGGAYGKELARELATRHALALAVIECGGAQDQAWLDRALSATLSLLATP